MKILKRCKECNSFFEHSSFWLTKNQKRISICKDCCLKNVNIYNPDTFMWILKMLDIPYWRREWDATLKQVYIRTQDLLNDNIKKKVLGQYIAKMKLMSFKDFQFKDTALVNQFDFESKLEREMTNNG